MNVYDSELVTSILKKSGYEEVTDITKANILILNTCAVREKAAERIVNKMKQHKNYFKTGVLEYTGIIGCVPQHDSQRLMNNLPFIDFLVGPDNYTHLPSVLDKLYFGQKETVVLTNQNHTENYEKVDPEHKESSFSNFISIIRGCNNFCTYCVVPYTRGRERSKDFDQIIAEAKEDIKKGSVELTLLGQNVNSYNSRGKDFADLLEAVANLEGVKRVRFATSHPKDLSEKLIKTVANNKFICNSIHLPFQAGSNRILNLMNRGYTKEEYLEKIKLIRKHIPDVALTADIIVGFPTETDDEFRETIEVVKEARYDNSFTFIYSERSGTKAKEKFNDNISRDVKVKRLQELSDLQHQVGLRELKKDIGLVKEVLVESESKKRKSQLMGRTEQNRIVIFDNQNNLKPGTFVNVKITKAEGVSLFGKIVSN